jgi:hypothetical protein
MTKEAALKSVMTLVACYPTITVNDHFIKMAVSALEDYHPSKLAAMCDPRTGIQMDNPNFPSISAMVKWVRNYDPNPAKPKYLTFPDPIPASPESKARIDEIVASIQWSDYKAPVKVTETDLESLRARYADLPPPSFSESAQVALEKAEAFKAMFGKPMPK